MEIGNIIGKGYTAEVYEYGTDNVINLSHIGMRNSEFCSFHLW